MDAATPTPTLLERIQRLSPNSQLLRYLIVGVFNTIFGYGLYVLALTLLNNVLPQRFLYLTVVAASVISTPFSITFAYFGYKLFVFRTRGNHLVEWMKCFAVYGTSQIPGLVALSALTRILQANLHATFHGRPLAGYLAGAIVIACSTLWSFFGHKKITFAPKRIDPSKAPQ